MIRTYADAGVNIDRGDKFAQFIASIKSRAISKSIGGFAGGIELDIAKYKNPVLLSATDGVGTKLLLTKEFELYDTIGIDLVAMSANDLIVCGAEPLNFLDYIACGKINEKVLKEIIKGIVKGCEESECILAGGETAEMPDIYKEDDFDLAGFCVGLVEKEKMLPKKNEIKRGDVILGLPSSGIHSNGLTLARKVINEKDKVGRITLLKPTKIYVKELKKLLSTDMILAAAHITGGGLEGNIKRTIPSNVRAVFNYNAWKTPDIFKKIMKDGEIAESEMRRVFNMGIGIALVCRKENANNLLSFARKEKIEIFVIGDLR
ncbi:MAG: phosphoribosylformylglycinamidine cyclo-ligase [Spirochaetes bacterium]|nr:phosphoribosylformylglycinamidine cyclo-ligase [Spirochaetota bacterium]